MSTNIKPTIGRRVWFRPSAQFLAMNPTLTQFNPEQPFDAGIVYVHHDHMVNLQVSDHVGRWFQAPSVPLLAGHWEPGDEGVYGVAEWMPYQKAQAAKTAPTAASVVDALCAAAGVDTSGVDLDSDVPLAPACDLSGEGACEACQ